MDRIEVIAAHKETMDELYRLRNAWAQYRSELFMAGKVEAADVFIAVINNLFEKKLNLEEYTYNNGKQNN